MKPVVALVLRWTLITAVIGCTAHFSVQRFFHSSLFKNWLYQRLLTGNEKQQLRAASALVYVHAEKQLLAGLKVQAQKPRELARRALEFSWFAAAGEPAQKQLEAALSAAEEQSYQEALEILNKLTSRHPTFAEAWNQRGALFWKLGRYEESILDCERALVLNPNHYGAWQGLGICKLKLGELSDACRCLRAALEILPHDTATRDALDKCEELLRRERFRDLEPTGQII